MADDLRHFKFSIGVLGLLDLFIAGLISTSLMFMLTEERNYLMYHTHPDFCVPCSNLSLHPDDNHDGIVFYHNRTVCCAKNKTSVPILVEKYASLWFKEYLYEVSPEYRGCQAEREDGHNGHNNNPNKEFFKIHGFESQKLNGTHHRRVHWDSSTKMSSENIGYAHEHGHITIHKKGIYHIYSQVITAHNTRPSYVYGAPNLLMHTITMQKKHENAEDRTVIGTTISQCATENEDAYETSYIGTVYQFREGDKVFVKVSFPEDVLPNSKMNFFGVHMI